MTSKGSQTLNHDCIRGWIFDVYPAGEGEIVVWIISETGERIRLIDEFEPKIYVSATKGENVERLVSKLHRNWDIAAWSFVEKYAKPTDEQKRPCFGAYPQRLSKSTESNKGNPKVGRLLKI
jgi:hypothetical protein